MTIHARLTASTKTVERTGDGDEVAGIVRSDHLGAQHAVVACLLPFESRCSATPCARNAGRSAACLRFAPDGFP